MYTASIQNKLCILRTFFLPLAPYYSPPPPHKQSPPPPFPPHFIQRCPMGVSIVLKEVPISASEVFKGENQLRRGGWYLKDSNKKIIAISCHLFLGGHHLYMSLCVHSWIDRILLPSIKTPKRQLRKTEIPIKTVTSWGLAKTSLGSAIKLLFPGGDGGIKIKATQHS